MSTVLAKAVSILNYIAQTNSPCGVMDISRYLGMPKASTSRLLSALAAHNLVIKGRTGLYQMGPGSMLWATAYKSQKGLSELCLPYLYEIERESGESVHLFAHEDKRLYYLERIQSQRPVSTQFKLGQQPLFHCTGGGKAILMALPEDELEEYLAHPLERKTPRSVVNREELKNQLREFRSRGYSEENGEHEEGIHCVGVPVLDSRGYPVGAISIVAASYRFDEEQAAKSGELLVRVGHEISTKLGRQSSGK
ncbi:IclR family transcriptional regulator [Pseudodesulfovibrio thermohalotolerans]|uniref:IclR family transcriptional regulator n=1 Tax=Pseudodesulfovibrio thermohalotolerans TaxID=2880651 RepID=UPI0024428876|nr:IclR family transcriptional regulator [Pseudodesulfovibrio thermohalotolerans]WFS62327.1 IclR family transcriptional regulator [Pseudodesulfovibrio thermohalotolerans]